MVPIAIIAWMQGLAVQVIITGGMALAMAVVRACDKLDMRKLNCYVAERAASEGGPMQYELATECTFSHKLHGAEPGAHIGCMHAFVLRHGSRLHATAGAVM